MDDKLFKAILAMDSYNHGYGEGIQLTTQVGITKIGNAVIVQQSNTLAGQPAVNAGFYAIAYRMQSGEKIISYRGTDDFDGVEDLATSKDVSAWLLGGGTTGLRREPWRFSFTIR